MQLKQLPNLEETGIEMKKGKVFNGKFFDKFRPEFIRKAELWDKEDRYRFIVMIFALFDGIVACPVCDGYNVTRVRFKQTCSDCGNKSDLTTHLEILND